MVFTVRPERGATVDKIVLAELTPDGRFALMGMPSNLVNRSALPDEFQSAANPHGRLVLNLALVDRRESDFMKSLASTGSSSRKLGLPFQTPAQLSAVVAYDPVNGGQPRMDLLRTEVLIGQWGVVGRLPVSMGTPGSSLKPTYYTETGALKKLVVSSRPPAVDSAKSLETAASSIIGGIKVRDEANSELAELRKTKEKLELEVAIQSAKTQLGKP